MTWLRLAGAALVAIVAGAGVGWLAGSNAGPPRRPKAIEDVLLAHDRGEAERLTQALADAGVPDDYPSPWREELRFARAAATSDWDALRRLGRDGPVGAGAARALLHVAARDPDPAERAAASDRMRAQYPRSWVLAARDRAAK